MIPKKHAAKLLELFRHLHGAPPIESEGGIRQMQALSAIFAEAPTDLKHADRMVNHLLVTCAFFPKAPEINAAADATRIALPPAKVDVTWSPVTEEELRSPEFIRAAKLLRCKPEELFGGAGSHPVPLPGFAKPLGRTL